MKDNDKESNNINSLEEKENENNEKNNTPKENKNNENSSEKNAEENKEKQKNNNQLYKELLIEDNSAENNKEEISSESENNNQPNLEHINDLNDYYSSEEYSNDRPKNIITVNDILGADTKREINLGIMNEAFNNFFPGKVSTKSYGPIKAYAANTNQGIARDYNEDRVSIIININQPNSNKNKEKVNWPKASYFSVFDGHGGNKCAEFLRDNLLKLICDNDYFPNDVEKAIKYGFSEADKLFLENATKDGELIDNSGSCGLLLLIIDNKIYIANVGDSRCIISMKNGLIRKDVTRDHKPNYPYEKERIVTNGGRIYQTQTPLNQNVESNENSDNNQENNENMNNNLILLGPHRVFPGSLSVSRTVGDACAKLSFLGGNPKVVISEPDIYCFNLDEEDIDFVILGCDGIYDQLTSQDVFRCAYMMIDYSKDYNSRNFAKNKNEEEEEKDVIDLYTTCANIVDFILKASMTRKSFDNVTCLIVAFKDLLSDEHISKNESKVNENKIEENKTNMENNDDTKKSQNEVKKDNHENYCGEKNDENKLPKLLITKKNDPLAENNKNESIESKKINNMNKKKIVIDKIQIKSIQKENKLKINNNLLKKNKNNELYSESPDKHEMNSGELSHRLIQNNNNLLKEFKYKVSKNGESDTNILFTHKNKLTLSTSKMKNTDLALDNSDKNTNNNIENTNNQKELNFTNQVNNNSNKKNLSIKKNRLNTTKKYFLNKKIKPLFIDNKFTNNKNKNKNSNFNIKITSLNNNNNNNNYHLKTGSSLNKLIPTMSGLNLYQNQNLLREKNKTAFSNNIPKITNINTIIVKNNQKNKLSLNNLLTFDANNKNDNANRNTFGIRLKSLNKKSISFYNNYAFNDLINNPKITNDKNSFQKKLQSQLDIFNINSNNGRNSYGNIKNKNNVKKTGKYPFSNDDKFKLKLAKPINLCSVNSNSNININKNNQKYIGNNNDIKGKKLIHNLTEDLLSENNRIEMPNINIKKNINNNNNINTNNLKKINFI